ncbi:hypothetical protein [Nitratireductor sp. ZSWI3]|uniref:hypothetical protein n=1 Tax=Nitratireductor sp. ZSWI3 TaxID=2966359 RepID=UPI00214FEA38|nr:hypothetical protein [Nitratireductor sp. ZSWI3]MCR4268033.1 hypothetical protein [Nitratireductor sp. ZSWI3]
MKSRFHAFVLAAPLVLAACSTTESQWVKDDTPKSEADQALADCNYQAEAATVTIGANSRPKTWGDAIADGLASGVERGMDEAELIESCMKAKGFTR